MIMKHSDPEISQHTWKRRCRCSPLGASKNVCSNMEKSWFFFTRIISGSDCIRWFLGGFFGRLGSCNEIIIALQDAIVGSACWKTGILAILFGGKPKTILTIARSATIEIAELVALAILRGTTWDSINTIRFSLHLIKSNISSFFTSRVRKWSRRWFSNLTKALFTSIDMWVIKFRIIKSHWLKIEMIIKFNNVSNLWFCLLHSRLLYVCEIIWYAGRKLTNSGILDLQNDVSFDLDSVEVRCNAFECWDIILFYQVKFENVGYHAAKL